MANKLLESLGGFFQSEPTGLDYTLAQRPARPNRGPWNILSNVGGDVARGRIAYKEAADKDALEKATILRANAYDRLSTAQAALANSRAHAEDLKSAIAAAKAPEELNALRASTEKTMADIQRDIDRIRIAEQGQTNEMTRFADTQSLQMMEMRLKFYQDIINNDIKRKELELQTKKLEKVDIPLATSLGTLRGVQGDLYNKQGQLADTRRDVLAQDARYRLRTEPERLANLNAQTAAMQAAVTRTPSQIASNLASAGRQQQETFESEQFPMINLPNGQKVGIPDFLNMLKQLNTAGQRNMMEQVGLHNPNLWERITSWLGIANLPPLDPSIRPRGAAPGRVSPSNPPATGGGPGGGGPGNVRVRMLIGPNKGKTVVVPAERAKRWVETGAGEIVGPGQ